MASLEPHEVTGLILGRISVFNPSFLGVDHQFLGAFACFSELLELERDLGYRGWPIGPISAWVISHKEIERGLPRGFTMPIVVREFCQWEIVGPVILTLVYVASQILFQPLIGSFRLPVGSWVVGRGYVLGDA